MPELQALHASWERVTGDPVVVIEDVMHTEGGSTTNQRRGDVQLAVLRAGTCAYVPGGVYPSWERSLGWVDRKGEVEILPLPPAEGLRPRVSPDGTRLVFAQGPGGESQVWVYDIGLEVPSRLTSRGDNGSPVWSPDGTRVVFASDGGNGSLLSLFWLAADGRGEPNASRRRFSPTHRPHGRRTGRSRSSSRPVRGSTS